MVTCDQQEKVVYYWTFFYKYKIYFEGMLN